MCCQCVESHASSTRFGFPKIRRTDYMSSTSRYAGLDPDLLDTQHGPRVACSAAASQRHLQRSASAAPQSRDLHLPPVRHLPTVHLGGPWIFPPWRRYAPALRCEGSATNVEVTLQARLQGGTGSLELIGFALGTDQRDAHLWCDGTRSLCSDSADESLPYTPLAKGAPLSQGGHVSSEG